LSKNTLSVSAAGAVSKLLGVILRVSTRLVCAPPLKRDMPLILCCSFFSGLMEREERKLHRKELSNCCRSSSLELSSSASVFMPLVAGKISSERCTATVGEG
jgi:hypothetical protein